MKDQGLESALGCNEIYAPSYLEQRAIENLVQNRHWEAFDWYDRAIIEDPRRVFRIVVQIREQLGTLHTEYTAIQHGIWGRKQKYFVEQIRPVFERQGIEMPQNTDELYERACDDEIPESPDAERCVVL